MRYSKFTIHFKEGDSVTFEDTPGKIIYDLKYPNSGALLVEKCDGNHTPDLPPIGGDMRRMISQLEEVMEEVQKHEHQFVVMYAPGTWTRVDFS